MNYEDKLNAVKSKYPFVRWHKAFEHGLEQYTTENCDKMQKVFDDLIADLLVKGEFASQEDKIESFRIAIEATNEVADETGMVETGEREDLCELTNSISLAAGLDFKEFGGGEGLASEWRDWQTTKGNTKAFVFPFWLLRQTSLVSRFLKPLSSLLIGGGVLLVLWPVSQTLYGKWSQRSLAAQFQSEAKSFSSPTTKTKARKIAAPVQKIAPWPLTKITISDINLDAYVVQGWDDVSLRRGPGHYERSSQPGEGNCVIAGHRNVYGSPFGNLDQLFPGSTVILTNRNGSFTYVVDSISTTSASDWSATFPPAPGQRPVLTLLTCTLPHSPSRVVLKAFLAQ